MADHTPKLTPLQWAVLLAYSHNLPYRADEHQRVRALVDASRPARCGPALVLARSLGLTSGGRITDDGIEAARRYLQTFRRPA